MSKTVTVKLTEPLVGHNGPILQVIVREPKAQDYFSLGEPAVLARSKDGSFYSVESPEVLNAYFERLIDEPKDPLLLGQMGLADAMKVKKAINSFFTEAQLISSETTATSS